MASDRWQELKGILEEALGLPTAERSAFLDRACSDSDLRRDIDSFIAHGEGFLSAMPEKASGEELLAGPVVDGILAAGAEASFEGQRIGPYRILEEIGQGGMGVVYRAEQEEPVRRSVALKLIKWGMGTESLIARFESERQALALMSHPTIARVYEAGATEQGQPYFAMEFVPGVPITAYCDRERLSLRERLDLFIQVCEGIQHAHQKGIIHRDIKPSNVLISTEDERALPKIIDFGIAKATSERLTDKSVTTELGQLIGTPEYMSPEQADMSNLDIDTRSDVYSLGVMLYELLVGAQPFDSPELRSSGFDEIRRKIREDDPPTPSRRLTGMGATSSQSAQNRGLPPPALERQLRGDLDWITMKALEKDRARRYGSPSELASDLKRHLNHEPVLAGPPSRLYRARKFVRRHRAGVAAAVVVWLALVVGIAGTGLGLLRAAKAERVASREAAKAKAVNDFMRNTLGSADPYGAGGNDVTVREALSEAVARIEELGHQPEVEGAVRDTIGVSFLGLGRLEEAERQLSAGLAARKLAYGAGDHGDVAQSLHNHARVLHQLGKHPEAEEEFRRAIEMRRRLFGEDHPDVADSMNALGILLIDEGRHEEAEVLVREALATRRRLFGDHHLALAQSLGDLGELLREKGEDGEAETYLRQSLDMHRELLGDDHPQLTYSLNNLGLLLLEKGELDDAERLLRESIAITRTLSSKKHPAFAANLMNLGITLRRKGALDEAEALYRESLDIMKELYGEEHSEIAVTLCNLGSLQESKGNFEGALVSYGKGLAMLPKTLTADHWRYHNCRRLHGRCLTKMARYPSAEEELLAAYRGLKESLGPEHSRTVDTLHLLAELYQAWGRPLEAKKYQALAERSETASP